MTWKYWICLYIQTHCAARGLRSNTIVSYQNALKQFSEYIRLRQGGMEPYQVKAPQILEYILHLRRDRHNCDSVVEFHVITLKNFYRAIVAMGHLEPAANPLAHFPKIKAKPRKLPTYLSPEEVKNLLASPPKDTVLGWRDRAILVLLYGTGIRVSECATLTEEDVDLATGTIRVTGKGGHQRSIPLNPKVVESLKAYRQLRKAVPPRGAFFRTRAGNPMSRNAIYERVRTHARRARITKRVSPHTLRHTFATHLVREGVNLVTIRELLGHRQITSTQIYLHVTAEDLRTAAAIHPIDKLAPTVEFLLPNVRMPVQHPPQRRNTG